jgi:hypothetical protein
MKLVKLDAVCVTDNLRREMKTFATLVDNERIGEGASQVLGVDRVDDRNDAITKVARWARVWEFSDDEMKAAAAEVDRYYQQPRSRYLRFRKRFHITAIDGDDDRELARLKRKGMVECDAGGRLLKKGATR